MNATTEGFICKLHCCDLTYSKSGIFCQRSQIKFVKTYINISLRISVFACVPYIIRTEAVIADTAVTLCFTFSCDHYIGFRILHKTDGCTVISRITFTARTVNLSIQEAGVKVKCVNVIGVQYRCLCTHTACYYSFRIDGTCNNRNGISTYTVKWYLVRICLTDIEGFPGAVTLVKVCTDKEIIRSGECINREGTNNRIAGFYVKTPVDIIIIYGNGNRIPFLIYNIDAALTVGLCYTGYKITRISQSEIFKHRHFDKPVIELGSKISFDLFFVACICIQVIIGCICYCRVT